MVELVIDVLDVHNNSAQPLIGTVFDQRHHIADKVTVCDGDIVSAVGRRAQRRWCALLDTHRAESLRCGQRQVVALVGVRVFETDSVGAIGRLAAQMRVGCRRDQFHDSTHNSRRARRHGDIKEIDWTRSKAGDLDLSSFVRLALTKVQHITLGDIGIVIVDQGYNFVLRRSSLTEALGQGLEQFAFSVSQMIRLPGMLIAGEVSAYDVKPVGPVGISQLAEKAIERSSEEESLFTILFFAGVISMALGITNLLPLPALDGGRILFVLIEALRGRRVDPAKEGVVHLIGMALLT